MSVAPQVFVCYGRADQVVAHAIGQELWRHEIESYNYLAKPAEDRAVGELGHLSYIAPATLFVAVVSDDSLRRALVLEEILMADQFASLSPARRRVYVKTSHSDTGFRLPPADLEIDWHQAGNPATAVASMLNLVEEATLAKMRRAWQINKSLYPQAWNQLNDRYRHAA